MDLCVLSSCKTLQRSHVCRNQTIAVFLRGCLVSWIFWTAPHLLNPTKPQLLTSTPPNACQQPLSQACGQSFDNSKTAVFPLVGSEPREKGCPRLNHAGLLCLSPRVCEHSCARVCVLLLFYFFLQAMQSPSTVELAVRDQ